LAEFSHFARITDLQPCGDEARCGSTKLAADSPIDTRCICNGGKHVRISAQGNLSDNQFPGTGTPFIEEPCSLARAVLRRIAGTDRKVGRWLALSKNFRRRAVWTN